MNAPRRIAPGAHAPKPPTNEPLVDSLDGRWCPKCREPLFSGWRDHDLTCLFCDGKTLPLNGERWHGTVHGYSKYGCRCPGCTTANAAYQAARRSAGRTARADYHGTTNGYKNYGCRCEACRAAKAAQNRKRYERREAA